MMRYVLFVLCLLLPVISGASDEDHDVVKRLLESGEIVSLEKLLTDARSRHSGRVLEIEVERERGQIVYEIEMVDEEGKVHEYYYDVKDGRLLWEEPDHDEGDE